MLKTRQAQRARCLCIHVDADSQAHFYRMSLSYIVLSGFVALLLAYWPASAGHILATLSIVRAELAAQIPDRAHKADRLPQVSLEQLSFEQRWNAVPALPNSVRSDSGQRQQPQAERRIEKIPFSCELAFSRLVTKGNFSTRCMARAHEYGTAAFG